MRTEHDLKRLCPVRLPTVRLGGVDYFVDFRLREFRTVAGPGDPIEFIPFASEKGGRMCRQCVAVDCPQCGQVTVLPRDLFGGERG